MGIEELGNAHDQRLLSLVPFHQLRLKPPLIPTEIHMWTVPEDKRILVDVGITPQGIGTRRCYVSALQCDLSNIGTTTQSRVLPDVFNVLTGGAQECYTVQIRFVGVGHALE